MARKSKKKIIVISLIIVAIVLLSIIYIYIYIEKKSKEINSVSDFENVKELIEYNECKYIKTSKSKEEGFADDIYMIFSKVPIEDDGKTNKVLYDSITSQIAGKIKPSNFRLIDTEKDIIIRVKFNENQEVILYTINNDSNYFEHLITKYQINNLVEEKQTSIVVKSPELNKIINNKWSKNNLNFR